jgi:hypothetical protein
MHPNKFRKHNNVEDAQGEDADWIDIEWACYEALPNIQDSEVNCLDIKHSSTDGIKLEVALANVLQALTLTKCTGDKKACWQKTQGNN